MKLTLASDLHHKAGYTGTFHRFDGGEVLILAGDNFSDGSTMDYFLRYHAPLYDHIIMVMGNHEYYCKNLATTLYKDVAKDFDNVHLLDNETVTIDGVKFIGSTLWSDFGNDAKCLEMSRKYMNDFRYIADMTPSKCIALHEEAKAFIYGEIEKGFEGEKKVVVTHFAPTLKSIAEKYEGNVLNRYFVNSLDIPKSVLVWAHGHTHSAMEYFEGQTLVACNPKGYEGEYTGFSNYVINI